MRAGILSKNPIRDYVAATSVGIVNGEALLDLCYEEDSAADVDMNVILTGAGKFVELQATAEHKEFDDAQLAELLSLGRKGVADLIALQRQHVALS